MQTSIFEAIREALINGTSTLANCPSECYISRICSRTGLFEICDDTHSVECDIIDVVESLQKLTENFSEDRKGSLLVGRKITIESAELLPDMRLRLLKIKGGDEPKELDFSYCFHHAQIKHNDVLKVIKTRATKEEF
jgi:hypothetical protein